MLLEDVQLFIVSESPLEVAVVQPAVSSSRGGNSNN